MFTPRNMIWDPASRQGKDRKRSDKITNIKAIILFRIKINANPYAVNKSFEISTDLYSDTVISVVHTNQEVDAHLTLFWDDYFRVNKGSVFMTGTFSSLESVKNSDLIMAISDYFLKQTHRGLTKTNCLFLEQKLSSRSTNGLSTFQSFTKTAMADSDHSFGHWIFHIIKLLKVDGTIGMWKSDLIDGFVPKECEDYFHNFRTGTFFLRFSERNPKIGVVLGTMGNKVNAWSPFSLDECRSRSLPDRLMDYHELCFIRNAHGVCIDKSECLSEFVDDKAPDEGYTHRGVRLTTLLNRTMYSDVLDDDMEMPENFVMDDSCDMTLFPQLNYEFDN